MGSAEPWLSGCDTTRAQTHASLITAWCSRNTCKHNFKHTVKVLRHYRSCRIVLLPFGKRVSGPTPAPLVDGVCLMSCFLQVSHEGGGSTTTMQTQRVTTYTQMHLLIPDSATNLLATWFFFLKPKGAKSNLTLAARPWRHARLWQVSAAGPDFIFTTVTQENINFLKAANEHGSQNAQLIPTALQIQSHIEIQIIILCHSWGELKFCCRETLSSCRSERVWESRHSKGMTKWKNI